MGKKTLIIISELFPPEETSTSYILGEIANASILEYEVQVICGPAVYDTRKKFDKEHPFILDPAIIVHRANSFRVDKNKAIGKALSFLMMSFRLLKLAKRHIKEGNKVLLVTNPAPLVLLMARLHRKRQFELNVLVHDVFPENTKPAGLHLPSWFYRFLKARFDKAYSCVDRFIVLGRDMAEVVRWKAGKGPVIKIVENWADTDTITPLPFPEGAIKLEYAGNIGRVQGLEKLIKELPERVELHFYGTGAMENTLKEIKHPGVFFHGPYFRSQQKEVLGACHAAIVTLSEGMYGLGVPSKAYNIMASGRPIIYFGPADGEIGRMVVENNIGYMGWPSIWKLNELAMMGEKARSVAESQFSKTIILDKFLAAIR